MEDLNEGYVNDITERVFLIQRELEAGKIKVAPHLIEELFSSLNKIRLLPDGRVDPDTVDGTVRAMGAAVRHFTERLEIKKTILYMIFKNLTLTIFFLILVSFMTSWSIQARSHGK